jgi:phospholipid transport system transporter-binding protein
MVQLVGDGQELALRGDLTVDTAAAAFRQQPAFPEGVCRLDLSGVGRSDSAGLALLVYWVRQGKAVGCDLRPVNPPRQMRSLMRVAGLDDLLGEESPGLPTESKQDARDETEDL